MAKDLRTKTILYAGCAQVPSQHKESILGAILLHGEGSRLPGIAHRVKSELRVLGSDPGMPRGLMPLLLTDTEISPATLVGMPIENGKRTRFGFAESSPWWGAASSLVTDPCDTGRGWLSCERFGRSPAYATMEEMRRGGGCPDWDSRRPIQKCDLSALDLG